MNFGLRVVCLEHAANLGYELCDRISHVLGVVSNRGAVLVEDCDRHLWVCIEMVRPGFRDSVYTIRCNVWTSLDRVLNIA